MKTKELIYATIVLALTVNFAACGNNDEPDAWKVEDTPVVTTVNATIAETPNTRIDLENRTDKSVNCTWQYNDAFLLIHSYASGTAGKIQTFTIASGEAGGNTASFTSTDEAPAGNADFLAFYPVGENVADSYSSKPATYYSNATDLYFTVKGGVDITQQANDEFGNMQKYHRLGAAGQYKNGRLENVTFKTMTTILTFNVTIDETSSIAAPSTISLKTVDGQRTIATEINYTVENGALTEHGERMTTDDAKLYLTYPSDRKTLTANFILPYQDLTGTELVVEVWIQSGGVTYTSEKFNGIKLEGGKRYVKDVTLTKKQ